MKYSKIFWYILTLLIVSTIVIQADGKLSLKGLSSDLIYKKGCEVISKLSI